MEYMRSLHLLKPGLLGTRPLVVITRDPLKVLGLLGKQSSKVCRCPKHPALSLPMFRCDSARGLLAPSAHAAKLKKDALLCAHVGQDKLVCACAMPCSFVLVERQVVVCFNMFMYA